MTSSFQKYRRRCWIDFFARQIVGCFDSIDYNNGLNTELAWCAELIAGFHRSCGSSITASFARPACVFHFWNFNQSELCKWRRPVWYNQRSALACLCLLQAQWCLRYLFLQRVSEHKRQRGMPDNNGHEYYSIVCLCARYARELWMHFSVCTYKGRKPSSPFTNGWNRSRYSWSEWMISLILIRKKVI